MEICQICFGEYIARYAKDHQCPDFYNCGACGEICDADDGTITNSNGEGNFGEFTHNPELCAAADEICEVCSEAVTVCTCQRCLECATIYSESDAVALLNDDNNCANCANEIGE